MKIVKLFKHFIIWFLYLMLYIFIMCGSIYFLYWALIKLKINDKLIAEIWADFAASFPGFETIFNTKSVILYIIDFLLTIIFIFGGLIILYTSIPILVLGIAAAISEGFVIRRKNNCCYGFICIEELFHLKHKERLTGTEWAAHRKEKLEEDRKRKKQEKNFSKEDSTHRPHEERQKQEQEESYYREQTHQENYKSSGNSEISEVEKARLTLMIDNFDFTKKELKLIRNKFIKKFHTDNVEENEVYAQKINTAYDILLNYAKEDPE